VKNLSLILNGILIIAVGYLYLDKFSDSDETGESINKKETLIGDTSIAYINSDSLLNQYDYYEVVTTQLEERRTKLQQEYTRRAEGLQSQIEDYQRTANNLTRAQAQAVEEDLGRKRQNLLQYQETIRQELIREETKITQELYEKVAAFLKNYGEQNNLQVVLTYSAGSGLLYANEGLDITDKVVEGLNEMASTEAVATDSTATN
jgi:outer membrane protein